MAELRPLRSRMIEDMTVRNLSPAMQRSYIHAVAKSSRYFGRSPEPAWPLGRPRLPGASGGEGDIMAGAEPDGMLAAVLLRRNAWPCQYPERMPMPARRARCRRF